jgi:hypothetical protein
MGGFFGSGFLLRQGFLADKPAMLPGSNGRNMFRSFADARSTPLTARTNPSAPPGSPSGNPGERLRSRSKLVTEQQPQPLILLGVQLGGIPLVLVLQADRDGRRYPSINLQRVFPATGAIFE